MNLDLKMVQVCKGHVVRRKDECYNCEVRASNTACENYMPIYVQKGYNLRTLSRELKSKEARYETDRQI